MSLRRTVALGAAFGNVLALGGSAVEPTALPERAPVHAPAPKWVTAAIGGCGIRGVQATNNGRAVEFSITNGVPAVAHNVDPRYNNGEVESVYTFSAGQAVRKQEVVGHRDPLHDFYGRPTYDATYVPASDLQEGLNMVMVEGQNFTTGQPEMPQGDPELCGGAFVNVHEGQVVGADVIDG